MERVILKVDIQMYVNGLFGFYSGKRHCRARAHMSHTSQLFTEINQDAGRSCPDAFLTGQPPFAAECSIFQRPTNIGFVCSALDAVRFLCISQCMVHLAVDR